MAYNRGKSLILPVLPSATVSATVNSQGDATCAAYDELEIYVSITAVGTATLTVNYQISPDEGTTWFTRASTATLSANGQTLLAVTAPCGAFSRINAVYGGSGNITYAIWISYKKDS